MIDFVSKKGFICDMDGVIYHGNQVLPGVVEFISWLHRENKKYLFLTNNSGYFGWVLGFGKKAKILEPAAVVDKFAAYLDKIREMY